MALTKVQKTGITDNAIDADKIEDGTIVAADIAPGTITNAKLAGSIANDKLANSSITVNGSSVSLGGSVSAGKVQWQSVVTADGSTGTSAVAGNGYFIDTTSAAHTLTLPGSPSAGDTIAIKDYAGTFGTNNLTIGRNGNNIQGVANDSLISTNRASVVLVYIDATKGWLYTNESNVADLQAATFITATGGTVTESGDYKVHIFTGDGCFSVSQLGNSATVPTGGPNVVDYFVVGGGGVRGGGAGGFRLSNSQGLPGPTTSPLATPTGITVTATSYPVTVGAGDVPSPSASGGSPSNFSTITSAGGGSGPPQGNGGSGAGNQIYVTNTYSAGSGNTPPTSPPQGNPGGTLSDPTGTFPGSGSSIGGAGGGGAGSAGLNKTANGCGQVSPTTSLNGGDGSYIDDNFIGPTAPSYGEPGPVGSTRYFAGGGANRTQIGAGYRSSGFGGVGGGGSSTPCTPVPEVDGQANMGGGGGVRFGGPSGNGGKGIVIIRYKYQ